MKVTLGIQNNGLSKGTLGWLCSNLGSIKIGETKSGKQGAWLIGRDGESITVLAVRGYWNEVPGFRSKIETVKRDGHPDELLADMGFTDAAWEIIERCVSIAAEAMNEPAEGAAEISITAKAKDKTE